MNRYAIVLSAVAIFASPSLATETSVPHINADLVHSQGFEGFGVTVVVIDGGIDAGHPGLAGSILFPGSCRRGAVSPTVLCAKEVL